MLNRRNFLILSGAAVASSIVSSPVQAALRQKPERSLSLYNIHTGERVKTVYWVEGHYLPRQMATLSHVLRDHRTDQVHAMDPRVLDILCALQSRLEVAQKGFHVICGYRSPETNAWLAENSDGVAQHSLHMEGRAVDVRVQGLSTRVVAKAAKSLRGGGVGSYPRSDFVHVDSGKFRTW